MSYKVMYYLGDDIDLRTKVETGALSTRSDGFRITNGEAQIDVPFTSMRDVEMVRLHGLGRMIRITCSERNLFVTVIRFNIAGYFVMVNFLKAGELYRMLKSSIDPASQGAA